MCEVECYDDSVGLSVELVCQIPEAFLSSRVPNLYRDFVLAVTWVVLVRYEFHADRAECRVRKLSFVETLQQ